MIRLQVDPRLVWAYCPFIAVDKSSLLRYIEANGWKNIPPVPVFKIPHFEGIERAQEYALLDGNHRKDMAEFRKELLSVALYEPEEVIDFRKDGLAEARVLLHPKRYSIIMQMYVAERRGIKAEIDRTIITASRAF